MRKPKPKKPLPDGRYTWIVWWVDAKDITNSTGPVFAKTAAEAVERAKQDAADQELLDGTRDWRAE